MKVIVKEHDITIIKCEDINEKESNIQEIEFEFSETYNGFAKYVLITDLNNKTEKIVINDNKIAMPYFEEEQRAILGVYAEKIVDDKLYRLNPKPESFYIEKGALKDAENHKEITPSEFEQYMQLLNEGLNSVDKKLNDSLNTIDENFKKGINMIDNRLKIVEESCKQVEQIGDKVSKQGLEAEKQGNYAKEQADNVISANNQAREIINNFEANVTDCTNSFNKNATDKEESYNTNYLAKLKEYNDNHKVKTNDFNNNASSKVKLFDDNAVKKTDDFNKNVTAKTTEFDNNAVDKTQEYNENAEAKVQEFNKSVEGLQASIDDNTNHIKDVYSYSRELFNVLPSTIAKGTDIMVKDATNSMLKRFCKDGFLKQETTNGYNLLNIPDGVYTSKNNALSVEFRNGVGTVSVLDDSFDATNVYVTFEALTLKTGDYTETNGQMTYPYMTIRNDNTNIITATTANDNGLKSFSVDESVTINNINFYFRRTVNGQYMVPEKIYPMILRSTYTSETIPKFEKFTNGASPNPDYPQDIKVLEGNFDLEICNKNLINNELNNQTQSGITAIRNEDGSVHFKGTVEKSATFFFFRNCYNFLESNQQYVLSSNCVLPKATYLRISNSENTNNFYGIGSVNNPVSNEAIVFNNNKDMGTKINCFVWFASNSIGQEIDFTLYPQLEKNDKTTKYEPHQSNKLKITIPEGEFAAKLSNEIRDRLRSEYNEDDSKYHLYLDKYVGKFIVDRNTEINKNSENGCYYVEKSASEVNGIAISKLVVCDYFKYTKNYTDEGIRLGNNQYFQFVMPFFNTINEVKEQFTNHSATIYYPLEKTYTLDLGAIEMPKVYKGINHIRVLSDLESNIEVEYVIDPKLYIDNMMPELSSQQLAVDEITEDIETIDNEEEIIEDKSEGMNQDDVN